MPVGDGVFEVEQHPGFCSRVGGIHERGASRQGVAVTVEDGIDHRRQKRVARAQQICVDGAGIDLDALLVEGNAFVRRLEWAAGCEFALARAHRCGDAGDLEPSSFASGDSTGHVVEGGGEERFDEPGLEFAGKCQFHLPADTGEGGVIEHVRGQGPFLQDVFELRTDLAVDDFVDAGEDGGIFAVLDRFAEQFLERPVDLGVAEHVVDLVAVHLLLLSDLGEQPLEYLALAGFVATRFQRWQICSGRCGGCVRTVARCGWGSRAGRS